MGRRECVRGVARVQQPTARLPASVPAYSAGLVRPGCGENGARRCVLVPFAERSAMLDRACRLREVPPKSETRLHLTALHGGDIMKHLNPALEKLEQRIAPDLVGGISIGIDLGDTHDTHSHHSSGD